MLIVGASIVQTLGTNVPGPATRTFAPSFCQQMNIRAGNAAMNDVAENRDLEPFILPLCSRIVIASSSACVGCSFAPSPALTIAACLPLQADEARLLNMTNDNTVRCHRIEIQCVSISVSPFVRLDVETLIFSASAERRFAAISNDVRSSGRVSKKRLMMVLPRSVRDLFDLARVDLTEILGGVENADDFRGRKIADAKKVTSSKWFFHLNVEARSNG